MTTRYEHALAGCTPTPLASYLKALAVLRLVAEQAGDPEAAGCWRSDTFRLRTQLNKDEIRSYFLERYQPMVVLSPWNGRAGFLEGEDAEESTRKGPQLIAQLVESKGARFSDYRQLIARVKSLPEIIELNGARAKLKEIDQRKKRREHVDEVERKVLAAKTKELKTSLLVSLRSRMPDRFVDWIDACLIVGGDRPLTTPLLGSGGNEGSMDLSINHVALLLRLINPDSDAPAPEAQLLLDQALFDVPASLWSDVNLGQLSPGTVGGPNMGTGFSGPLLENPWSAVLALEGAVLFNASASKRLDSTSDPALSFPFLVDAILAGAGGVAWDESARPEIWLPLWKGFSTYNEIQSLIRESRMAVGRRKATSALDAARAVATLGVDRGISIFQRYGIFERRGQGYYVTTPIGRFAVPTKRNRLADLISDLDNHGWLKQVHIAAQSKEVSTALRAAVAQFDAAVIAMTQQADRAAVEKVLRQLGCIESLCASSPKIREAFGPVPTLSYEWVRRADDGTPEFRIALALAGLSLRGERDGKNVYLGIRPHLAPVTFDAFDWDSNAYLACWSAGTLEHNLATVFHRRRIEAAHMNAEGELLRSRTGAKLKDVQCFLAEGTNDRRITELLWALACTKLDEFVAPKSQDTAAPTPAYALLKPLFTSESALRHLDWLQPDCTLRLPAQIPARLAADDTATALELAWRRLRALGVKLPGMEPPTAVGIRGPRLLAALMIPLTFAETGRLLRWLNLEPEPDLPEEVVDKSS